ncbi:MAG: hypothetical protein KKG93_17150 [Bacteroidetes bacterium]|nr:hypothetical protein [Bacteroidota bacterium]
MNSNKSNPVNLNLIRFITAGLLVITFFDLPYGYYQFLRVLVTVVAAVLIYYSYSQKNELWLTLFFIILILFNPIFPIYFKKEIWIIIDIISAIVFIVSIKFIK